MKTVLPRNLPLAESEKALLRQGISSLEALSADIAKHGLKDDVQRSELPSDPGVYWRGADVVIRLPGPDERELADKPHEVVIRASSAGNLAATFDAIAGVVTRLSAYDAQSKYEFWSRVGTRCAQLSSAVEMDDAQICQEAIWESARVLKTWIKVGVSLPEFATFFEEVDDPSLGEGAYWFMYGNQLLETTTELTPDALYVSKAALRGWKTDERGNAIPDNDPGSRILGVILFLSLEEQSILVKELCGNSETTVSPRQGSAVADNGAGQGVWFFAAKAEVKQQVTIKKEASPDISLPFFAYGLFMPGQLGYRKLAPHVKSKPQRASVTGNLWERDGIPLLERLQEGPRVGGFLMVFKQKQADQAYAEIQAVEPKAQYRWKIISCKDERTGEVFEANVLEGWRPDRGGRKLESAYWDGRQDVFFTKAFEIVDQSLSDARELFESGAFLSDPEGMLRIQMAYTLLWSAIERFTTLSYSLASHANGSVAQRVGRFADEPAFRQAISAESQQTWEDLRAVFRSDSPDSSSIKPVREGEINPGAVLRQLYQVRCNIVHRGKEAGMDMKLMITATTLLTAAFKAVLNDNFGKSGPI